MPEIKTVSRLLTNVSVHYKNASYVAQRLLPVLPVPSIAGEYAKYRKEDAFTIPDHRRGPKSQAREVDWASDSEKYKLDPFALKDFVADRDQNAGKAEEGVGQDVIQKSDEEHLQHILAIGNIFKADEHLQKRENKGAEQPLPDPPAPGDQHQRQHAAQRDAAPECPGGIHFDKLVEHGGDADENRALHQFSDGKLLPGCGHGTLLFVSPGKEKPFCGKQNG